VSVYLCLSVSVCVPADIMALANNKVIILGALAGVAGISVAAIWYHNLKSRRRESCPGLYLDRSSSSAMTLDAAAMLDGDSQMMVLDRLEALIQCVSELKDEMKALKSALPLLPDQVREELRAHGRSGGRTVGPRRTMPTRRKRAATAGTGSGSRGAGQSSEEAESEGG